MGPEVVDQVSAHSQQIAAALDASKEIGAEVIWKPVLTSSDGIRRVMLEANADDACLGVICLDAHVLAGEDVDRRAGGAQKPLLHLHTQANEALPWSEIDMDFMNLNQAAHGDREFGYIQTRLGVSRKTVAGHVNHQPTLAAVGSWVRAARGAATLRSLRLARFGDNMRDVAVTEGDKVEAQRRFGVSVNTYGVNDLVGVVDQIGDAEVDALVRTYEDEYTIAPALRAGAAQRESLRYAARIELGLRAFLEAGRFGAFTTNFEDLGGLRQLPGLAVQRLMADGYGFGGEGDWKTSLLLATLKSMDTGAPAAPRSWRTTPTTSSPGRSASSARTCSRCARPSPPASRAARSIRWVSATARTPCGWSSTPNPAPELSSGSATSATGSAWCSMRSTSSRRTSSLPKLPVARAVWTPRPDFRTSTQSWLTAGGPHHTVLSTAVGTDELDDLATWSGSNCWSSTPPRPPARSPTRSAGTRPTTGWRRGSRATGSSLRRVSAGSVRPDWWAEPAHPQCFQPEP